MKRAFGRLLAPVVLVCATALAQADPTTGAEVTSGDGLASIESYDVVRKMVAFGRRSVGLSPAAAGSLDQQLSKHGLSAGQPFVARFNVVRDAAGRPMIESIYVFPPRKK